MYAYVLVCTRKLLIRCIVSAALWYAVQEIVLRCSRTLYRKRLFRRTCEPLSVQPTVRDRSSAIMPARS